MTRWYRVKLTDGMAKPSRSEVYVESTTNYGARKRAVAEHPDSWFDDVVSCDLIDGDFETVKSRLALVTQPNMAILADGTIVYRSDLE